VTIKYFSANGTAIAPADYTAVALTTLIFSPGETTKTFTVEVAGDALDEADETFLVNLYAPTRATIADSQGVGTIKDNDLPPGITITDATVTEPDSGTVLATFTIKLSAASGQTVTVSYATANGTGISPADYTAIGLTTLTFSPGQPLTKTVTVAVKGETLLEANETFFVNLSGVVNATLVDAQGLGTILNDD
jgi:hypothetical protein